MKSRISLYDAGVGRNLLRRFWPLWTAWFFAMLLVMFSSISVYRADYRYYSDPNVVLLQNGVVLTKLAAVFGVVAAMAMFHYLYQPRGCGMMNCLPLRRETVFLTAFFTGLVPALLLELLLMLLLAGVTLPFGVITGKTLLRWFCLVSLSTLFYYCFAVFCAMLTGHLLVLPLVFTVLNFSAVALELCMRRLLRSFVYGFTAAGDRLAVFSPPYALEQSLWVYSDYEILADGNRYPIIGAYHIDGLGLLAVYALIGLVFAFLALLLYRKREMERATDVVAIPGLKPVFKYCLSFGGALVFASLIIDWFVIETRGPIMALYVLLLLLFGALLGYFAAEMLIQKSLWVFRGHWRGAALVCALLTLFVAAGEFDLFGYERRLPAADEVLSLNSGEGELGDIESIEAFLQLHRDIIRGKKTQEQTEQARLRYQINLNYTFKNGRTLSRSYTLYITREDLALSGSLARKYEAALNVPELRLKRAMLDSGIDLAWIDYGDVYILQTMEQEEDVVYRDNTDYISLSAERARELYLKGILPDAQNGVLGRRWLYNAYDAAYYEETTNLILHIRARTQEDFYSGISFEVPCNAANTLRYLKEVYGVEAQPLSELGYGPDGDVELAAAPLYR